MLITSSMEENMHFVSDSDIKLIRPRPLSITYVHLTHWCIHRYAIRGLFSFLYIIRMPMMASMEENMPFLVRIWHNAHNSAASFFHTQIKHQMRQMNEQSWTPWKAFLTGESVIVVFSVVVGHHGRSCVWHQELKRAICSVLEQSQITLGTS